MSLTEMFPVPLLEAPQLAPPVEEQDHDQLLMPAGRMSSNVASKTLFGPALESTTK